MDYNLYGLCVTKDEEDIIGLSLKHASQFCKEIFVLDNGSHDNTWQRVNELSIHNRKIVLLERKPCQFGFGLRAYIFNRMTYKFRNGDWILILDSDEFLEEDPAPSIAYCERYGFDVIYALQAQFYVTRLDVNREWYLKGNSSIERFQDLPEYYLINWREPRLFKYKSSLNWPDMDDQGNPAQIFIPIGLTRKARKGIVNRHYQYRSLPQMKKRLKIRSDVFRATGRFPHNRDTEVSKYLRNHKRLKHSAPGKKIKPTLLDFFRLYLIKRSKRFKRMLHNRTLG